MQARFWLRPIEPARVAPGRRRTGHQLPRYSQSNLTEEIGALAKYRARRVADIEFRGIAGTDPAMLRSLLEQKTNEPLDREKLRASLKALYATGRFATLQVEAGTGRAEQYRLGV